MRGDSGCFAPVLRQHLASHGQDLLSQNGLGKEADLFTNVNVISWDFAGVAEDKNREVGHSGVELSHEGRAADAGAVMAGDDQAEASGEQRLLHQAQRRRGVAGPPYVWKSPFQDGLAQKRLERVVVHQ